MMLLLRSRTFRRANLGDLEKDFQEFLTQEGITKERIVKLCHNTYARGSATIDTIFLVYIDGGGSGAVAG